MSNRSLFIVALVALIFCGYLYFKGGDPGTREREETATRLLVLNQEDIQRIEITNPGGTYVFQKAGNGEWGIEKPIKFPADSTIIGTLLSELESNQKRRVISPGELKDYQASLAQFGLKDPRITARFFTGKDVFDLQLGNKTPSGNLFYALVRDPKKQELAVVDDVIEGMLMQNLDLWRNRQIFDFTNDETVSISLRKGTQEVEVVRDGNTWNITKPLQEAAVQRKMQEYLALISSMQAQSFISETGGDPAQYGLNTPAYILDVKLKDRTQTLRVGKAKPETKEVYGQFGDRPAIFMLSSKTSDSVANLLDIIRPRQFFHLNADTKVRTIEITQGNNTLVLKGQEDDEKGWMVQGDGLERKANGLGASDMIQAMHMVEAVNFYSSVDNPNAEYGLQNPSIVVKVSGVDPTQKDKTFERKVQFGSVKENLVYVQSSALPFVVDTDKRFIAALPKGIWGWFDPLLGLPAADEITGLTWTQGPSVFVLNRDGDKWVANPSDKNIDERFLKVQLSYLTGLKARRWVGKAVKKDFAKPRFVLEIRTGGKARQLILGQKQADGTTLARLDDDDYAFVLSEEDVQKIMVRPIPGGPAVAPAPVPAKGN